MSDKIASKPLNGPIEYDFGDQTPDAWPRLYIAKDDHVAEKLRYARALTQICSYCGWEAKAGGGSWSELQAHIYECPTHPVGEARRMMLAIKRTWGPESNDDGADGELWNWINDYLARHSHSAKTGVK